MNNAKLLWSGSPEHSFPAAPMQVSISQLYIALDDGEAGGIVRCMADLGMEFSALSGGEADPELVATAAAIMFDTRYPLHHT